MAGKSTNGGGGGTPRERLRGKPGWRGDLGKRDPDETFGRSKEDAAEDMAADLERLMTLQERLYAESKRGVLIVLQGIDAAGKDGTVTHVMSGFNPAGVFVTSFKVPNATEAAHD